MTGTRTSKPRAPSHRTLQASWNAITRRKIAAGCGCEIKSPKCDGQYIGGHHKLKRRFGDYSESNHLNACAICHEFLEQNVNRPWALLRGFIVLGNHLPPMRERTTAWAS